MLSENNYEIIKKFAWILFFVLLVFSLANLALSISKNIFQRTLPFSIENGIVVQTTNDTLEVFFENKIITKIDTSVIDRSPIEVGQTVESDNSGLSDRIIFSSQGIGINVDLDNPYEQVYKDSIEIVLKDTLTGLIEKQFVQVDSKLNKLGILGFAGNIALIIFAFFNSFLLLK